MRLIGIAVLAVIISAIILVVNTTPHSNKRETFSWPAGQMVVQKEVYVCGSKSMDLVRNGWILPKTSICR